MISYKEQFKEGQNVVKSSISYKIKMALISQEFIEIFCSHDLANSDYAAIQIAPLRYNSFEDWVDDIDIETILKSITYIIWTDKIVDSYFNAKVEDRSIYFLLRKLELLLNETQHVAV